MWPHVFTTQIDLIHALWRRYQESNEELLRCHVNVRSNLTSCLQDKNPVLRVNRIGCAQK